MRHAWAAKLLSCWSDMRKCHCNATTFWFVAWAMANLIGDIAMLHLSVRNCCWNPHRTAFQPHGIAAARSKNKTIDSRCHLGKVNVFLAAGTNNTLHSGCCPGNQAPLQKSLSEYITISMKSLNPNRTAFMLYTNAAAKSKTKNSVSPSAHWQTDRSSRCRQQRHHEFEVAPLASGFPYQKTFLDIQQYQRKAQIHVEPLSDYM